MKILIITGSLPYPPASGGALRAYGIIKGLYEHGHHVTLISYHTGTRLSNDHPLCKVTHNIITVPQPAPRSKFTRLRDLSVSSQPDIARRLYTDHFAEALKSLLMRERFDLIQVEGIEVACYLPVARQAQPYAKLSFDTFNAEYLLQRSIAEIDRRHLKRLPAAVYSYIQARRIEQFEKAMCQLSDLVIAVSGEDAAALRQFRTDGQIHVIPSGIFVDQYQKSREIQRDPHLLVFTGKMDYRPNVDAMTWFYEAIFPHIATKLPDIRLTIVGQQPHPRLEKLRNDPRITITGWVDSVQPYLDQAGVYIAPLRMGSGTRLKLLEAMASHCAIVATSMATAGLNEKVKSAIVVIDEENRFADAVVSLIRDEPRRREMGDQAYQQVKAHYDWQVLTPLILKAYEGIGLG